MSDQPLSDDPMTEQAPLEPVSEQSEPDEFRDALKNLSAALDRFARAAEVKARDEWQSSKPEIQRAIDEMRRGVEGLARKSTTVIDLVSRRLSRDGTSTVIATTPEAPPTEREDLTDDRPTTDPDQ